jgi:hypothetical protein
MPPSIEDSERMLADWNRAVQAKAERYQAMADRVSELSITERSQDSTVEVTISSRGLLTNLVIAESAAGKRMADVSSEVMRTVQLAQSKLPELMRQAMAETIGLGDETANKVFEDAKSQFPEPPEDPVETPAEPEPRFDDLEHHDHHDPTPAPPTQPPRRRPTSADDDDDFDGSIFN